MSELTRHNRASGLPGHALSRAIRALLAALFAGLLLLPPASAQDSAGAPAASDQEAGASDAEIDSLVRRLEDPEQRAALIEELKLLKAAERTGEPAETSLPLVANGLGAVVLSALSAQIEQLSHGFSAVGDVILQLPAALADLAREAQEPQNRQRWMEILGKLVLVLGAALIASWLADRLLARPRRMVETRAAESLWVKLPMLILRLLLELLPIAAFAAVAYVVLPLTDPRPATRLVALAVVNAIIVARAVRAIALVLLAPSAPQLRLPHLSDESAHYCYIWVSRLTAVTVYGYFLAQAALLLGLPPSAFELLLRAIGLFVAGMLVVLILQNRAGVAAWLRGRSAEPGLDAPSPETTSPQTTSLAPFSESPAPEKRLGGFRVLRHRLADVWHVLAIVYVAASYLIWALDVPGGFEYLLRATVLSAVVLALLRLVLAGLQRIVQRGFALSIDLKQRFPALETRTNRYLPVLEKLLQIALYVFTALWLLEIWGVDSFAWLASELGRRLTGSVVTIVIIVIGAALLLEIMDAVIERYLSPKDARGRPVMRSARARTLLPLMRNAMRILLGVMVTLIVLSELGVNIAPLLAGAGVVGLAIGFGAQTLVKDVITGFFILAEDTLSVGDVADIDGNAGVVEAMTIRTIRLRDGSGTVYTIPFSAVTTVKNLTKDFSFAMFNIRVTYGSDIDKAIELMRGVAAEMRQDPHFRYLLLDDLEVMGLDQFTDTALVLMARLRTPPGKQWTVSREFNRRLKAAFDAHGIDFPNPQRAIRVLGDTLAGARPAGDAGDGT
jgi:small conductance mechanosensitive channel